MALWALLKNGNCFEVFTVNLNTGIAHLLIQKDSRYWKTREYPIEDIVETYHTYLGAFTSPSS